MEKYIGNIFVSNNNYKTDTCFKKCLSFEEVDKSLPTLIIGLENAKEYIEDFNILKKSYNDNMLWWTFTKMERRTDYEKDIVLFQEFCINNIVKDIKYYLINYTSLTYSKAKKCLRYINNTNKKYYYIDNNKFVFVYDVAKTRNIYGFSLNTSAFFGLSKNKIVSIISNNPNNRQMTNFYSIPNRIRMIVNNDVPSEMVLNEYFC